MLPGPLCFKLCAEYVLVQPPESLLNPAQGQGQVHPQMAGAVEGPAVLEGDAYVPGRLLHHVNGFSVGPAPFGAVQKQHIGALGAADKDAGEPVPDVIAGEGRILGQDLPQFLQPLDALGTVCSDQISSEITYTSYFRNSSMACSSSQRSQTRPQGL